MAHRTPAPLRAVGALLRALLGLALLVALVGGVPYLLLTVGHQPTELSGGFGLLMEQDDGSLFLVALTCIGWAGWAAFTLSVLVETVAVLRRRSAPQIRGMSSLQSLASFLIGGIVLLAPTAASAATTTPAIAATALHTVGEADNDAAPGSNRVVEGSDWPEHTVASTTELPWDLAEEYLGDGKRWKDIAALNPDIPQLAAGDQFLPKDVVIKLPADARTIAPAGNPPSAPVTEALAADTAAQHPQVTDDRREGSQPYEVESGDTLWGIAEDELGDGTQYKAIFEKNRGAPQPGGTTLTDPDEIRPGLTLDIPFATAPSGQPPNHADSDAPKTPSGNDDRADADHGKADAGPGGENTGAAPHESGRQGDGSAETRDPAEGDPGEQALPAAPGVPESKKPSSAPSASAPATAEPSTPASPSRSAPNAPTAQREAAGQQDESPVGVRETAGIGMLLAGCLIATVGIKRLLQRRRRHPGETIAMPQEPSRLEQVLEANAEPASIELLDTALRTLAHHAAQQSRPLPAVRGARVSSRTVELLVDTDTHEHSEPSSPFTRGADGRWTLDAAQTLLDLDQARTVPAPYPGLVTLGTDLDGSHLLLNLTDVRVLLLDGDADAVRNTARVIALEAATSAWSDHAEILTVGLDTELPTRLPKGRLRAVPHLRAAQSDLGELLLEHHQHPVGEGDEQPAPLPWMLICAADATEDDARQLAAALAAARGIPVALVLPAAGASAAFPDSPVLPAATDTPQPFGLLDSDLIVQSLTDEEYREFLDLLRTADEPAQPAEGSWRLVPPVQLDEPTAAGKPAEPLHLAGPVTVPDVPFTALTGVTATSPVRLMPVPSQEHPENDSEVPVTPDAGLLGTPHDEPPEAIDLHTPEIQVLGPVTVTGVQASGHGFKLAQLAALVYFKPGVTSDTAREAMDPRSPWSKPTLQARISELRTRLGADADGALYLPRDRSGSYRLSSKVRCDWTRFQQLSERGLAKGPAAGITDLEAALALVRGRPFGGADLSWAAVRIQEMLVRIADTAHTLATWHRSAPRPDLDAARRAVRIALDVDDSAEVLYQDWMLIEDQAGHREGVRTAYETLRDINRRLDVGMEAETERVYDMIMSRTA
ncbi:LysM peptidoglycan-binding domain-containing protein (plasmid) [Streptomyces scopuliridis]|uniref:LysM peptidoglycan-binding domain-containing protein n=1 Tax=Streptomyces scopuliridis TaxID=452529 RepID=UPI002DDBBD54|nr:LysM peptidoglycan-binding domain-containing protein [Streptomyces scopuliridis]WSB39041.1 LysM peptidoglycan-binding domain-containing protein [Streptomyces scopuliridis]